MRKVLGLLVVFCALAIPVAALAANWPDPAGQNADLVAKGAACVGKGEDGAWYHFVNNQTGGPAPLGTISVNFTADADDQSGVGPLAYNNAVRHFYIFGESTVLSAETTLPGKLVISGAECGKKNETDPRSLFH